MANDSLNESLGDVAQSREKNSAIRPRFVEARWQRQLLPFLVGSLGVLTVFLCATIALETRYIQRRMESALEVDLRPAANQEFRTNGAFLLEANLIERRYRAATVAALSRVYLVFLGFGTGMVMTLVGATFILGKISEQETSIDGEGSSFKASLRSGSPGVILAFFGTALMLSTIFSKTDISVSDRAVYMGGGFEGTLTDPNAQSKMPDRGKTESKGLLTGMQKSTQATPIASEAKNDNPPPDLHLRMAPSLTFDGDYSLKAFSGLGTLSIRGHDIQFAGLDGKKRSVAVSLIDQSHIAFSVGEPDGGRQEFDGFLTAQSDIVGSTTYKGSFSTGPSGFTATRIKQK
jgi:hypothetical protein